MSEAAHDWRRPTLVAAWPGMGAVAQIAATHLAVRLQMQPIEQFDLSRLFDPTSIRVADGVVQPFVAPHEVLHGFRNSGGDRDLLVLLSDRQPTAHLRNHARLLLERARALGVERVVTFAAMATPMHLADDPRVFATATAAPLLDEALAAGAVRLDDGEISGMNGLLLGAAAEHGLDAIGLLGEMPFFASNMPNPKSAAAVLTVFARLTGVSVDVGPLRTEARRIEAAIAAKLPPARLPPPAAEPPVPQQRPALGPEVIERIESLFAAAASDRSKALELKAELDRHGLFRDYEDRFLDLFRQGS